MGAASAASGAAVGSGREGAGAAWAFQAVDAKRLGLATRGGFEAWLRPGEGGGGGGGNWGDAESLWPALVRASGGDWAPEGVAAAAAAPWEELPMDGAAAHEAVLTEWGWGLAVARRSSEWP